MALYLHRSITTNSKNSTTKMNFNNANDVYRPILIISTIAAICTIKHPICKSKTLTILTWVVFVILLAHLIMIPSFMQFIETTLLKPTATFELTLHFITKAFNQMLVSLCGVAPRLFVAWKMGRNFPKMFSKINTIDKLLGYKKHTRDGIVVTLIVMVPIVSISFQLYSISRNGILLGVLVGGVNLYNLFAALCCEIQFMALCFLLGEKAKLMNGRIEEMIKFKPFNQRASKLIPVYSYRNKQDIILEELQVVNQVEEYLNEVCDSLKSVYNPVLLVSLSTCFLNALFNYYYTIFGGFSTVAADNIVRPIASIVIDGIWALLYTIRFAAVCISASTLCNEKTRTKSLLCSFLDSSWNTDIKYELRVLLAKSSTCDFNFSACGFFDIDTSLITSAVGAGATYLVILAQFHK